MELEQAVEYTSNDEEQEGNELAIWVYNRDDGKPPLKPQEIRAPTRPPFLILKFPYV